MKQKFTLLLFGACVLFSFFACGRPVSNATPSAETALSTPTAKPSPAASRAPERSPSPADEQSNTPNIRVTISDHTFTMNIYDNETAEAFTARLPLTLDMSELNGNEKFNYLGDKLPAKAEPQSQIQAGELMLYGSDCLVLFYESFPTTYSYTKIGYMENTAGLAEALGGGSARVTFSIE